MNRLYEIPKESKIIVDVSDDPTFVIFKHIDGAFSVCITEKGEVLHLSANTPLTKISENTYEIYDEKKTD